MYYLFDLEPVIVMPKTQAIISSLLRQHTPISFKAFGPSMNPTIRNGESVFIQPLDSSAIFCGSVILYMINERITVHRCIFNEKRTKRVYTVGDAAVSGGDWIPVQAVLGVAESMRREGRIRRLDTRFARWAGLARYALRPMRRALWKLRPSPQAHAPARRAS